MSQDCLGPKISKLCKIIWFGDTSQCLADLQIRAWEDWIAWASDNLWGKSGRWGLNGPKWTRRGIHLMLNLLSKVRTDKLAVEHVWSYYGCLNEYLQGTAWLLTSFEVPYFGFTLKPRRLGFFFLQLGLTWLPKWTTKWPGMQACNVQKQAKNDGPLDVFLDTSGLTWAIELLLKKYKNFHSDIVDREASSAIYHIVPHRNHQKAFTCTFMNNMYFCWVQSNIF